MRPHVTVLSLFLLLLAFSTFGRPISSYIKNIDNPNDDQTLLTRVKRQLENFDNDDYSLSISNQDEQEEPGFWDRVVKVALKLFNKFIEWLNSS